MTHGGTQRGQATQRSDCPRGKEDAMSTCAICRFETELDDIVLRVAAGRCVCLRCYARETGAVRRLPRALRRDIAATLAALEVA